MSMMSMTTTLGQIQLKVRTSSFKPSRSATSISRTKTYLFMECQAKLHSIKQRQKKLKTVNKDFQQLNFFF